MAEMPDVATLTTISSNWGNQIRDRTIQRYSSVANRTTEHSSPTEGDLSYLADTNSLDVYDGTSWIPVSPPPPSLFEVDGSVEVATANVDGTSTAKATVNLTIPTGWASWKCEAHATGFVNGVGMASVTSRIRIDGTDQQALVYTVGTPDYTPVAVGGRRTGMTTTGSRAVSLMVARAGTGTQTITDVYLYARAVRTS